MSEASESPGAERSSGAASAAARVPVPFLDFSREYSALGPELLRAAEDVFASQQYVGGPAVAAFEEAAARRCQVKHAISCSSGTDALWLSLAATGLRAGDHVITTPFSFFATASAILRAGATPVFADIAPSSFNLSPEAARSAALRVDAKAILPVHLYGQIAEWGALSALAAESGAVLIEDAAQAFGATWEGKPAGSLGHAAAFSFYPTKNLSAAGEAGMVTTGDAAVAERIRALRSHGMRRRYLHEEMGWNSRMDTLQAAVLLVKLRYVDGWNSRRRALAARYDELFHSAGLAESALYPAHGVVIPAARAGAVHVFHQYVIRVRRRDELRAFLMRQEIGSEVYYPLPLHLQPALADLGYRRGDFPESERAAEEALALPIFPQLRDEEQARVVSAIAEFLG